jgi:hypothetical protein
LIPTADVFKGRSWKPSTYNLQFSMTRINQLNKLTSKRLINACKPLFLWNDVISDVAIKSITRTARVTNLRQRQFFI